MFLGNKEENRTMKDSDFIALVILGIAIYRKGQQNGFHVGYNQAKLEDLPIIAQLQSQILQLTHKA